MSTYEDAMDVRTDKEKRQDAMAADPNLTAIHQATVGDASPGPGAGQAAQDPQLATETHGHYAGDNVVLDSDDEAFKFDTTGMTPEEVLTMGIRRGGAKEAQMAKDKVEQQRIRDENDRQNAENKAAFEKERQESAKREAARRAKETAERRKRHNLPAPSWNDY